MDTVVPNSGNALQARSAKMNNSTGGKKKEQPMCGPISKKEKKVARIDGQWGPSGPELDWQVALCPTTFVQWDKIEDSGHPALLHTAAIGRKGAMQPKKSQ